MPQRSPRPSPRRTQQTEAPGPAIPLRAPRTARERLVAGLLLLIALVLASACLPNPVRPTPTPNEDPCAVSGDEEPADDDCGGNLSERHPPGGLPQLLPTPAPASPPPDTPMRVETVLQGLNMPLGLVWTPDGRKMFFSEVKLGQIRVAVDGVLQPEPFVKLPVARGAETGMLGLAVDPDYDRNRYLYAYYSDPDQKRNVVLRFEDRDNTGVNRTEIFKAVAISERGGAHNAGRLAFAKDGTMYVSAGNSQNSKIGQDPCKLGGKVLHINRDGSRTADAPFACAPTYALGFRNPFGLAIHPVTGAVFVTENGGHGHDEFNLLRREGNYGHSLVEGIVGDPRFIDPLWESGPVSTGPSGLTFYTGDRLPEFKNDAFYCHVHTGQLTWARLAAPAYDRVEALKVEVMRDEVDCRLDVANGPDGALYFSSLGKIGRITR